MHGVVYLHSQRMRDDTDWWPHCCRSLASVQTQLNCEKSSWSDRSQHLDRLKETNAGYQQKKQNQTLLRQKDGARVDDKHCRTEASECSWKLEISHFFKGNFTRGLASGV